MTLFLAVPKPLSHHEEDDTAGDPADDLGVGDDALLDGVQAAPRVEPVGGRGVQRANLIRRGCATHFNEHSRGLNERMPCKISYLTIMTRIVDISNHGYST